MVDKHTVGMFANMRSYQNVSCGKQVATGHGYGYCDNAAAGYITDILYMGSGEGRGLREDHGVCGWRIMETTEYKLSIIHQ